MPENEKTLITLQSLELLEQRRREIEQRADGLEAGERYHTAEDRVLFAVLLQQLRSAHELNAHLVATITRIEQLEHDRRDDRELLNAVMRDAGDTRRLVVAHEEQIKILATTLDVALDKLSSVVAQAEQQARELADEARMNDR